MTVRQPVAKQPFQLSLPIFEGTVEDLIRLASERRIPTDDIETAAVAAQYARYLESSVDVDLEATGEFLALATRLLLLKSTRVLAIPVEIEEPEFVDQEDRSFADRDRLLGVATGLRAREGLESLAPLVPPVIVERRAEPRSARALLRAWHDMQQRRGVEAAPLAIPAFVRLEAAVSGLIRRLKSSVRLSFSALVHGSSRHDAVVHFIAVLELVRRRQATVEQDELFGDITVEYADRAADSSARAG
jgi:segregation and condensation protein A